MPKYTFTFQVTDPRGLDYTYVLPHVAAKCKQYAIRIAQTQLEKEIPEFQIHQVLKIEDEE